MDINGDDPETHPSQPPTRKRGRASMATYADPVASGSERGMSVDIDPELEHKRRKARERQRRKRERDRQENAGHGHVHSHHHHIIEMNHSSTLIFDPALVGAAQEEQTQIQSVTPTTPGLGVTLPSQHSTPSLNHVASQVMVNMTPEEATRKEKVRIAARERQRKHRARTKAKRLAEASGMSPLPVEIMHVGDAAMAVAGPPDGYHHRYQEYIHTIEPVGPEPPFQVLQSPAQTFANTLLLSFSCTPLMKQHLLQSLNMSNQDLASLEPYLAAVWESWDRQRQLGPHTHPAAFLPPHHHHQIPHFPPPGGPPPGPADIHDFRARFQRPLPGEFGRPGEGEDAFAHQQQHSEGSSIDPSLSTPEEEDTDAVEPSAGVTDADFEEPKDDEE